MNNSIPNTTFSCTQCGGELHPDQGQLFETCPFCDSTVYLDKAQVVFHWYLAPTLDETKARTALARWMSGNDTVKDLDKKAKLVGKTFAYFPLWYFKRQRQGKERVYLQPAAATSVSELKHLNIPAGDLRNYDDSLDTDAIMPTVPLETARKWLARQGQKAGAPAETAVVHVPIYTYKYAFGGHTYTAVVEAATGRTLANIYPEKSEAPYLAVGGITIGGFLLLALIPVLAILLDSGTGEMSAIGVALAVGLAIPFGAFCFGLAAWVAAKV